jgi:hypothetical protein
MLKTSVVSTDWPGAMIVLVPEALSLPVPEVAEM